MTWLKLNAPERAREREERLSKRRREARLREIERRNAQLGQPEREQQKESRFMITRPQDVTPRGDSYYGEVTNNPDLLFPHVFNAAFSQSAHREQMRQLLGQLPGNSLREQFQNCVYNLQVFFAIVMLVIRQGGLQRYAQSF